MSTPADAPSNFRPDAFAGTAELYAAFRPPYPPALLADLVARAGPPRRMLVDLATGPGRVALDLAPRFERVIAIDQEPEMIAVATRRAEELGVGNVTWRTGRAEDLEMAPGSVDLVTIGEAFHRLDQARITGRIFDWLRPAGCLVTMGTDGRFSGERPWESALREVRDRWVRRAFGDDWGFVLPGQVAGPEAHRAAIRAGGFPAVEDHELEEDRELTFEEIVGYLASTSVCSRRALGPDFPAWETDLRAALRPVAGSTFTETIRWGYTLARKPA